MEIIMKKILLTTLVAASLNFAPYSAHAERLGGSTASEVSLLAGGSLIVAVSILPIYLLEELSANNSTTNNYNTYNTYNNVPAKMTVNKVTKMDNGNIQLQTKVNNKNDEKFDFEISPKVLKDVTIEPGTEIKVSKNEIGYTLNANSKVIGIVPNENTNKLLKQQKM